MFRFWYRFVPQNMSLIQQGAGELVYTKVKDQINAYMGVVFEEICRQYLWKENLTGNLPILFTDLGRWWGNDPVRKSEAEIDLMGDNDEGEALFAECKWRNEDVGEAELKELLHKSSLFHHHKKILVLFSKTGFTAGCADLAKRLGNVLLISYEDMVW